MRVAVTGATGLLGRYTVDALRCAGHEVLPLSRGDQPVSGVASIRTDYSFESLRGILGGAEVVVHLAGVRGADMPLSSFAVNVDLTDTLLHACEATGIGRALLASSISVYSVANPSPWEESCEPVPVNKYGMSKLAMEKLAIQIGSRHNLTVTSLRFGHVYGALEHNDYLINRLFRLAATGQDLRVTAPSSRRREMVYAGDAADAVLRALRCDVHGPVNVRGYQRLSNYEIALAIVEGFHTRSRVVVDDAFVDSVIPTAMDGRRAADVLGYLPRWPMAAACREIQARMESLYES
jgi:UDP-glucose 4-epimerase